MQTYIAVRLRCIISTIWELFNNIPWTNVKFRVSIWIDRTDRVNILYFETLTITSRNVHLVWIYVKGTATSITEMSIRKTCNISLPSSKYKIIRNTICSFQWQRHIIMKSETVSCLTKSHRKVSLSSYSDYFCARAANFAALRRYVSSLTRTLVRHGRFEDSSRCSVHKMVFLKISVLLSLSATFSYS